MDNSSSKIDLVLDQNHLPDVEQYNPPGPTFNRLILALFFIFSLYLVLPLVNVPLLGLSLSAPIFFFIAIACVLKPPRPWFSAYRRWIALAVFIWMGIFISAIVNGLLSGGANIDNEGLITIVRYAYWLLVFIVTAYFASQAQVMQTVVRLLGWGALVLALLRWGEVLVYGNIGAYAGTHLLTENDYGFLFSVFSPFLLVLMIQERGWKKMMAIGGFILLVGAAAINGSRGSWVAIAVGVVVCFLFLAWTRSKKIPELFAMLLVMGGIILVSGGLLPNVTAKVMDRFSTLQKLEEDKSYMTRQVLIQKGIRLFEQSPIFGVGASRFTQSTVPLNIPVLLNYRRQDATLNSETAHNSYLDFLAESGLAGSIPYGLLLIFLVVQGTISTLHGLRENQYIALAVFLAFIQMSVHMWAIASLTNTANWFIYGLVVAASMVNTRQSE